MKEVKTASQWKKEVDPVLISKVDEFRLLGYESATKKEIWDCLSIKVWKGNPEKRLHSIVQDIFHLNSHTYVSFLTNQAYQNDDLEASLEAVNAGYNER
ncbi:post-transcriptional regulator [Halobacillus sp. BBL2006]|uniref:post-transcriptional regulator n=1 Tax=Halobacillus sp. BBL2006 TaxID=1543706 RepID=UPI00054361A1|nr:post-transcriptional regulator [Halobacillus sp. BBL2006]KHE73130.1 hypothetical protein LD39_00930 [Halobacillus sp. BBL2006]